MIPIIIPEPPTLPLNLKYRNYIARNYKGEVEAMSIEVIDTEAEDSSEYVAITFRIEQMAGCNGVAIIRAANILERYRGKGFGGLFNAYLERFAACVGWSVLLCSVARGNAPMEAILRRRGYSFFNHFHNPKTGNDVNLYYLNLKFKNDGKELA